jgi:protein O-mannosyl-transferase
MDSYKLKKIINNNWFWLATILIFTFILYFPTFQFEILNYDDDRLIVNNELIQEISARNLKLYFVDYYDNIYQPFVLMSWAFDYAIDGLNSRVFHIHNLVLHLINIGLVFFFIQLLFSDKRISIITTFLFAVHSMHIESVAWISERKDLLYAMYFLLSLIMYIKYVKSSQIRFYVFSLVLFLFSLFSKGLAVALAPTIVAIDFFLKRKIFSKKVIIEKIPFLIFAIFFSIVGSFGFNNLSKAADFSLFGKLLSTGYVFFHYFIKMFIPYGLSAYHPYPSEIESSYPSGFYLLSFLSILIIITLIILSKKSRRLAFGTIFFGINIFIALRISQITSVGFIMADRYAYVSSIGIFILISVFFIFLIKKIPNLKIPVFSLLITFMIINIWISSQHIFVWENSISIWDSIIEKYPDRSWPYSKRGLAKADSGDYEGAICDFSSAIFIKPDFYKIFYNRAETYGKLKMWDLAIHDYSKIIYVNSDCAKAYAFRGIAYEKSEMHKKALNDFNKAIKIDPESSMLYLQRAMLKTKKGYYNSAIQDYNKALAIQPDLKIAQNQKYMVLEIIKRNYLRTNTLVQN